MAAIDPQGAQKHCIGGLPFPGVLRSGIDTGTAKYWIGGLVVPFYIPASGGASFNPAWAGSATHIVGVTNA